MRLASNNLVECVIQTLSSAEEDSTVIESLIDAQGYLVVNIGGYYKHQ